MNLRRTSLVALALALLLGGCSQNSDETAKLSGFPAEFAAAAGELKSQPPLDLNLFVDENYNPNDLGECPAALDPYACAVTVITLEAEKNGIAAGIELMRRNGLWDADACFPVVKAVGGVLAANKNPAGRSTILQSGDANCVGAFNEGVYEQSFKDIVPTDVKSVGAACNEVDTALAGMCNYHLGTFLANKSLVNPQAVSAVCQKMMASTKSADWPRPCDEGVWRTFFENTDVIARIGSLRPSSKDVLSFCSSDVESANLVCVYEAVRSLWQIPSVGDNDERFGACAELSGDLLNYCESGAGRGVAAAAGNEPQRITDICSSMTDLEHRDSCFQTALGTLDPATLKTSAPNLCNTTENRYECVRGVSTAIRLASPEKLDSAQLEQLCKAFPSDTETCEDGLASALAYRYNRTENPTTVDQVFANCQGNSLDPGLDNCMRSALTGLSDIDEVGGLTALAAYCETATPRVRSACMTGVGRAVTGSKDSPRELAAFCATGDGSTSDPHRGCVQGVLQGLEVREHSESELAEFCAALPTSYATLCRTS